MTIFRHRTITPAEKQRNDKIALVGLGVLIGMIIGYGMLALNLYISHLPAKQSQGNILMVTPRNAELSNPYSVFMPVNVTPAQAAHNDGVQRQYTAAAKH